MQKRLLLIIPIMFVVFLLVGVLFLNPFQKEKSDALKFKEEYESLNGQKLENGKTIRTIEIASKNPFVYKTAEEIVDLIDQKKTFAVYFGFDSCPWCRSVLPTLLEVTEDLGIDQIYYVSIKEIRDTLAVNQEGKVETMKKGSEGYYQLLKRLDSVLSRYTLKDSKGKDIDTKEKRIYAPNVVSIVKGKAEKLTTGISEKQEDGYMKLTKEMQKDTYNQFQCVLTCIVDEKPVCSREGC